MSPLNVLSVCSAVLTIKWYLTIFVQGGARFKGGSRPKEDSTLSIAKTIGKGVTQSFGQLKEGISQEAVENDIRWQRIVQNDIENIPLGLIVSLISNLSGSNELVNNIAIIVFTIARVLHTFAYAKGIQPWRAIFWGFGVLSVVTMALNGLIHSF